MTDTHSWKQIEALFDAAWELPELQRRAWLQAQPVPADWIVQAMQLLDAAGHSVDFLEPAVDTPDSTRAPYSLAADDRAGHWRVVRALGRGGMGEVYEVERVDGQFQQRAAMKLLAGTDASAWQRFQIERQILANLDHPGIARMIDGSLLENGRPYMVMEYVDGLPIDAWCDQRDIDLRGRVELVIEIGAALAHAHGRLIVHRDLKPSNVLVDTLGRARLIDFGIARLAGDGTADGAAPLSLDYAAPEQAAAGVVSTATDVHGLAAILYRLVSGHAPRQTVGMAPPLALASIRRDPIPALHEQAGTAQWASNGRQRALLGDLDAILAKAMQGDPRLRYQTAEGLCDDLKAALQRGTVEARAHQRRHRWGRQAWKQRWALLAAMAIVASLAAGLVVALWQAKEVAHQRDSALREQARLEAVQQSVFHMFRSAGELKGGEATATDVLGNAAQRIQDEFARDPQRGADVLQALGELYFLLTDYEAAKPLLRRLADADPQTVNPALIAGARYDLAQVLLREGDATTARQLLAQAQGYWNEDPIRWVSRLVDSRLLESQLLKQEGQGDAAIALLTDGLRQRVLLSGEHHRETGVFHNNLGVALFGLGRLAEARDAFRAARRVWQESDLQQSPDALNTLNNWGAVELADGQLQAATPLFREAVDLRRRYFGPSAATAALLGNYGKLLLQSAEPALALTILREAAEMGEQFAGRGSLHHVAANSGLVEAELISGDPLVAERSALAGLSAARESLGPDHVGTAMASVALARVRGEQQNADEATALLDDAERIATLVGGSAGSRLSGQVAVVRQHYRLEAHRPVPDTATPLP